MHKVQLELLRAATAEHHAGLEEMLPLMDAGLSLATYTALIQRFYGFVAPLEEVLWEVPGLAKIGMHREDRRKVNLLERDLSALGCNADVIYRLPRTPRLPRIDSISDALGVLYVTEGSTLGGQVIRRRLKQTLGIGPTTGAAYFTSYGVNAGAHWKEYLNVLSESESHSDASRVVSAAVDTFAILQRWLATDRNRHDSYISDPLDNT